MECNKEEARRAMDIAERKLSENDYNGAKKFANKAQDLYPELDGLKQVLTMIDVYISASNQNNGGGVESDWYGILGVDPLADDETLKKQYKNLARLLHPDKNNFNGAEGAFILVSDAWCLLSDHSKRIVYDQKWKSKEDEQKMRDASYSTSASDSAKDARERAAARVYANEAERKPTGNANSTSEAERLFKKPVTVTGNANYSTSQAERLFKNPMERANANSTAEAERLFKKPVTVTGNANYSTSEAERLFKNPMKRANANCTSEAERLFKKPMRYVI